MSRFLHPTSSSLSPLPPLPPTPHTISPFSPSQKLSGRIAPLITIRLPKPSFRLLGGLILLSLISMSPNLPLRLFGISCPLLIIFVSFSICQHHRVLQTIQLMLSFFLSVDHSDKPRSIDLWPPSSSLSTIESLNQTSLLRDASQYWLWQTMKSPSQISLILNPCRYSHNPTFSCSDTKMKTTCTINSTNLPQGFHKQKYNQTTNTLNDQLAKSNNLINPEKEQYNKWSRARWQTVQWK